MPFLNRILGRSRKERDLDAEIQGHLQMEIQLRIDRGERPEEARGNALKDFGNVALVKEVTRQSWSLRIVDTMLEDLRFALRLCVRYPAFSGLVVLILGITLGVNTAIFGVMNAVMLRSLPYEDPDRVVTFSLQNRETGEASGGIAPGLMLDLQESRAFLNVAVSVFTGKNWTGGGEPLELQGVMVSSLFFEVLGVKPHIGTIFSSDSSQAAGDRGVVFTHGLWRGRLNGSPDAIGKPVILDGTRYTLTGVLPEGFIFPDGFRADFYLPLDISPPELTLHNSGGHLAYARLSAGITPQQAQELLNDLARRLEARYPETNAGLGMKIEPLKDRLLSEAPPFPLIQAAGLFVLLIGCANLASLFISRSIGRSREMLIRASLGASRGRLVQQMLIDGGVLGALGGAVGLVIAFWAVRIFPILIPEVPRIDSITLDSKVLAFTAGLTVLSIFLFALFSAFRTSSPRLNAALNRSGAMAIAGWGRLRRRGLLVGAQVAMTLMLLILAGLNLNSIIRLHNVNPGFDTNNILTMQIRPPGYGSRDPQSISAFYEEAIERISGIPGVQSAAAVSYIPMAGAMSGPATVTRGAASASPRTRLMTPDYFRTLSIPIVKGRGFDTGDRHGTQDVAMVNEMLAKHLWESENPVGSTIEMGKRKLTVVGVARDVLNDPYSQPRPELYLPLLQAPRSYPAVYFLTRTAGSPQSVADIVRARIWEVDKDQPISDVAAYTTLMRRRNEYAYFLASLQSSFALIGIGLAALGIYSVLSYAVGQRAREICLRMALGAQRHEVVRLVIRQAVPPVFGGLMLGLASAIALAKFASSRLPLFLFKIRGTDVMTYAAVTLLLLAVASLAAYLPARRASRVDPSLILRHE